MFSIKFKTGKQIFPFFFTKKRHLPFEKVNARGKKKDRALSLTKKDSALSLTRITFFSKAT